MTSKEVVLIHGYSKIRTGKQKIELCYCSKENFYGKDNYIAQEKTEGRNYQEVVDYLAKDAGTAYTVKDKSHCNNVFCSNPDW